MKHLRARSLLLLGIACVSVSLMAAVAFLPNLQPFRDASGYVSTYNVHGDVDENSAFFQPLGSNGRTCATCHQFDQSMSLEVNHVRQRFYQSAGNDPLFAPVDGANCPDAHQGDATAHSMLLNNGLIRIGVTLPAQTEFSIAVVSDPYGCALTTDPASGRMQVSVYRRPLPTGNLGFLSAVMWDGRETANPLTDEHTFSQNLAADLRQQAIDAVLGHAQASQPPTDAQLADIVNLELGLYTAQLSDDRAAVLFQGGGHGGPLGLSGQNYYPGINDSLGHDPHGNKFNPKVFDLYSHWINDHAENGPESNSKERASRADIAAGEQIFNTARLKITAVRGLNDNPDLGYPDEIDGTCTTCHDSPNAGNHSLPLALDIAVSHSAGQEQDPNIAPALAQLSQPAAPVFLINNCPDPRDPRRTLAFYTSDPGKGLISGKCSDVNRVKGPVLRGLAARAPYFHNGSAANLNELVNFYEKRFQMNLTDAQERQLIAFLNAL
jgi:cytochrome c peroxidase